MKESIEEILRNGYGTWRKNTDLALPFLFDTLTNLLLTIFLGVCFCVLFSIPLTLDAQRLLAWATSIKGMAVVELAVGFAAFFVIYLFISMLVSSFFYAGAIAMAKKAAEGGRPTLDDMLDAGRRRFFDVFLTGLAITSMLLAAFVLFVGAGVAVFALTAAVGMPMDSAIAFGANLFAITAIAAFAVFFVSQYFVVIGGTGVFDALKKSYGFFAENKLSVLLMYSFISFFCGLATPVAACVLLIVSSVGLILTPMPMGLFSPSALSSHMPSILMNLSITFVAAVAAAYITAAALMVFIIQPLNTTWVTLLYMSGVKEK